MKVFLDDLRQPPKGWLLCRWPDEAIRLLMTGAVTDLSLDHDLGNDRKGTGYDVVTWMEKAVVEIGLIPPNIKVHSANISARKKMELGIRSINRLYSLKGRKAL